MSATIAQVITVAEAITGKRLECAGCGQRVQGHGATPYFEEDELGSYVVHPNPRCDVQAMDKRRELKLAH